MFYRRFALIGTLLLGILPSFACAAGLARHVVVVVWDGMRPDFVTPELTPNLWQLAREGVTFQNHHSVYLSATEVNGTALATGAYPSQSGIMANKEYRPEIDTLKPFGTEAIAAVRKGDLISEGHYLHRLTVAEILQRKGYKTAIAGAKPVALLHDRADRASSAHASPNLSEGLTLPTNLLEHVTRRLGQFPAAEKSKTKRDIWTTQALLGPLWEREVPAFSLLWLSEPDFSQHETGPGSELSLTSIKGSDENLASVLRALDERGVRAKTDIFVVSDHGFSTISRRVDVATNLTLAGFTAAREFKSPPRKDDIVVSSNGGAVLLYVIGRDPKTIDRVVSFLQGEDYTGVIFTRKPVAGTFTLAQAKLNTANPPDIVFAMRWTAGKNTNGVPGLVDSDDPARPPGQGMHVTLSPYDMHNILFAAGPDFRRGVIDPLPTGNTDIAPTVLKILGVKPPKALDGRVLTEAMTGEAAKGRPPVLNRIERIEAKREHARFTWHQYLVFTEVGGVLYLDEGNGSTTAK